MNLLATDIQSIETIVLGHAHMDHTGAVFPMPLVKEQLASANIPLTESKSPTSIANDTIAVTGQVERTTGFEKGMPNACVQRKGRLEPDQIWDDQTLILHFGKHRC